MASVSVTTTLLEAAHPLAARELAHACGAEIEWVVQLVEIGIIEVRAPAERPDEWRFQSTDLQCALAARRLERDFGVGLDAAALILDLQHEVRRLKAVLAAQGLEREI
ncbi:MAG: MerR family transcriptional regulator [Variovorax sp.]|nr:MAG: MerR family transcriptional regulator [Variovorax sp.]